MFRGRQPEDARSPRSQLSGKQRCLGRRIVSGNLFCRLIDFLNSLPQLWPDNRLVRALMGNPFRFRFPYHGLVFIGTGTGAVLCELLLIPSTKRAGLLPTLRRYFALNIFSAASRDFAKAVAVFLPLMPTNQQRAKWTLFCGNIPLFLTKPHKPE